MAVRDREAIADARIRVRGEIHRPGDVVPRGFVQVASHGPPSNPPAEQSGRLELADWLVDSENPLTARVAVNRIWHHLFGAGLVRTVDNFGTTGELPSHQELLDYLAVRFVEDGWSVKQMVKQMMLSRVYQLSTEVASASAAAVFALCGPRLLKPIWRRVPTQSHSRSPARASTQSR